MKLMLLPKDDIFISYPRQGGSTYASGLAKELIERGFSPFVDKFDAKASPNLTDELRQKIRQCRMFVIIGTKRAGSRPIIKEEIEVYLKTGRQVIVPIDFNNAVRKARWYPLIEGIPLEPEPRSLALKDGLPSKTVLDRIERQFTYKRSKEKQQRTTLTLGGLSVLFIIASIAALVFAMYQVSIAQQAKADANQFQAQAAKSQQERETAQNERDRAELNRINAQKQAEVAKAEALQNQEIATEAQTHAQAAVKLQQEAESQTRVAVGESMLATGYQALSDSPSDAVNLSFAAKKLLGPQTDSTALLTEALEANPIWFQFVPEGTERQGLHFTYSEESATDKIALDKSLTRLLYPSKKVMENQAEAVVLTLREIPTGKELSSKLVLSPEEEFVTPEPLNTQLVIIRKKKTELGSFRLHDLSTSQIEKPVFSVEDARNVQCTGGSWPCFVLMNSGEIIVYASPQKKVSLDNTHLAGLQDVISFSVHPSGKSLVFVRPSFLTWLELDADQHITQRSDIALSSPPIVAGENYKVRWGPQPKDILLARNTLQDNRFSVEAFNGNTKKVTELYHHEAFTFLPPWSFETARQGTRFVVKGDRGQTDITVANDLNITDVEWAKNDSNAVASILQQYKLDVRCRFDPTTRSNLELATISPNGNYVVTARSTSGKTPHTTYSSVLEQWDLLAMDQKLMGQPATVEPVAVELKAGQTRTPVTRLAYSEDSSRLLVWDGAGTINMFLLTPDLPDRFNQKHRMPMQWSATAIQQADSSRSFTNVPLSISIKNRYKKWIR